MPSLSQILKSKIGKGGKSKTYVASELKVSEKTIENYMNGKREPKQKGLLKLGEILGFSLSDLTDSVEQNVPNSLPTSKEKAAEGTTSTIESLAKSNAMLAEAALVRAETDKMREEKEILLVSSNSQLTEMLKPTAGSDTDKSLIAPSRLIAIQELLAEIATGALTFESKEAALREIGIRMQLHVGDKVSSAGTHTGAGRKSTAERPA